MNPLVLKGTAGALGLTAIAGVVKLSIGSSIPRPISLLLEKNRPDKRLLFKARGAGHSDGKNAGKKYVSAHSGSGKNPFSVNLSFSENNNVPDEFMKGCETLFNEKVLGVDDDKYEQALEYCTRDTLVSDFTGTAGKQLAGDTQLKELWKQYYKNSDDFWNLKKSKDENNMPNEFKTKCSEESNVKTGDMKHPSVERVINYCSTDRPKEQSS